MTSCIAQFSFFFYRPKPIHVDFSGGQISSDAGLLPLRAFDQRHGLTRDLAQRLSDPRADERVQHSVLSLLRQRLYQIVAGYEDANDADRLRYDPAFQILADQPLGQALGSQPTLSRWENAPSAREIVFLHDALLDWFVQVCGERSGGAARFCWMSTPPTTEFLQRGLQPAHVSPATDLRASHRLAGRQRLPTRRDWTNQLNLI